MNALVTLLRGTERLALASAVALAAAPGALAQVQWVAESPASSPSARRDAVLVGDANDGFGAVLFGGIGTSGAPLGDTWSWDGAAWSRLAPRTSPSARSEAAAESLEEAGVVAIFGGLDASGKTLSDLWTYDGDEWVLVEAGTPPPGRAGHTMTHDMTHDICVVFGGRDDRGEALSDTWIFDGARWSVGNPEISPAPRWGHSAISDPEIRGIIIVGGRDERGTTFDDMWHFDGANWSLLAAGSVRPPARAKAALSWHDALGVALLHGGEDSRGAVLGDTWIWDGASWSIVAFGDVNDRPAARKGHALAYDHDTMVLFGGETPGAALALRSDTWTIPACGMGTVNAGAGAPTAVLFVNESAGAPGSHEVEVAIRAACELRLAAAPLGPVSARYALLFWLGRASNPTPLVGPGGAVLGCTVNPTPLRRLESPQPFRCLRGSGIPSAFCGTVTELPAPPRAPFTLRKSSGFGSPIVMTVQGLIEDAGAANPTGFSVTNCVVLIAR